MFVDSRIFGVIVSVPKDVKARRLSAVPIWRLLREAPDFCEQIGYQQRKDRRDALEQAVCAALAKARDAVETLADEIPVPAKDIEGLTSPERAALLAQRLLGLEIDQVVAVADRAYRKRVATQPEAAQAIADAVRAILPAVYDHGVVETVRGACGDAQAGLLALPAYHHTVAEIVMAGADRRPLDLCARRDDNHFPKGRLCLPEPPECGFDEDGRQAMAAIEEHLAHKLALDSDHARLALERAVDGFMIARFAARSGTDAKRSDAQRQALAAREIKRQADTGRTHYLILRAPEEADDHQRLCEVARTLRTRYPGLMCIELSRAFEHEDSEFDRFRPFLDLLPKQRPQRL